MVVVFIFLVCVGFRRGRTGGWGLGDAKGFFVVFFKPSAIKSVSDCLVCQVVAVALSGPGYLDADFVGYAGFRDRPASANEHDCCGDVID
jgi:hypothetical protein